MVVGLKVGLFIVFCDQAHHSCVVSKLDYVGVKSGYKVMCIQGVQHRSSVRFILNPLVGVLTTMLGTVVYHFFFG